VRLCPEPQCSSHCLSPYTPSGLVAPHVAVDHCLLPDLWPEPSMGCPAPRLWEDTIGHNPPSSGTSPDLAYQHSTSPDLGTGMGLSCMHGLFIHNVLFSLRFGSVPHRKRGLLRSLSGRVSSRTCDLGYERSHSERHDKTRPRQSKTVDMRCGSMEAKKKLVALRRLHKMRRGLRIQIMIRPNK